MGVEHGHTCGLLRMPGFDTSHLALLPLEQRNFLARTEARHVAKLLSVHPAYTRTGFDRRTRTQVVNSVRREPDEPWALHKFVRVGEDRSSMWTALIKVLPNQDPELTDFTVYQDLNWPRASAAIISMSYRGSHVVQDVRLRNSEHGTVRAFVYSHAGEGQPIGSYYRVQFFHTEKSATTQTLNIHPDNSMASAHVPGTNNKDQLTVALKDEGIVLVRQIDQLSVSHFDLAQANLAGLYVLQQARALVQ